jgi:hypothetical protein
MLIAIILGRDLRHLDIFACDYQIDSPFAFFSD